MKSATFAWAALAAGGMVCLGFLGSSSGATEYRDPGRAVYVAQCAMCHGDGGKGDWRAASDFRSGPADLTDSDLADETDAALIQKVMHAPRPMPELETEIHQMIQPLLLQRASADAKVDAPPKSRARAEV
jgi:mono/diheme cytochrome c family protein